MNLNAEISIIDVKEVDLAAISSLTWKTWPVSLAGILPEEQIKYMLSRFYSPEAIKHKIDHNGYIYKQLLLNKTLAGYLAVSFEASEYGRARLCEILISPEQQGGGLASPLMRLAETAAADNGCDSIYLFVNKKNPAVDIYSRKSYKIVAEVRKDIGSNFIMDDFVMTRNISADDLKRNNKT